VQNTENSNKREKHRNYTHKETDSNRQQEYRKTTMWANAQRDGRPAEYRWRPLFNAAKFG